jgi:hypothetical protein
MKGFATSPNPFFGGIKPRGFFMERNAMLKREKLYNSISYDARIDTLNRNNKTRKAA